MNASPPERSSGASLRQAPDVHILIGAPSIMPVERATSSARSGPAAEDGDTMTTAYCAHAR
jgi:hypothetical protein